MSFAFAFGRLGGWGGGGGYVIDIPALSMALLVLRRRKREVLPFDCLSGKRLPWGNCSQWVGRGGADSGRPALSDVVGCGREENSGVGWWVFRQGIPTIAMPLGSLS